MNRTRVLRLRMALVRRIIPERVTQEILDFMCERAYCFYVHTSQEQAARNYRVAALASRWLER